MRHHNTRRLLVAGTLTLTASLVSAACEQPSGTIKLTEEECRVIEEVTATWEAFRGSLGSSDCQDSLKHLNLETRAKYEPQLCKEESFAKVLLKNCTKFGVKEIYAKTVSGVAQCTTQAGNALVSMEFGKRANGTWAITSM